MTSERAIKNSILKYLRGLRPPVYVFPTTNYAGWGVTGAPDYIICYKGLFVGLEVKRADGVLSDVQRHNKSRIEASGGVMYVVRSVGDVRMALAEVDVRYGNRL